MKIYFYFNKKLNLNSDDELNIKNCIIKSFELSSSDIEKYISYPCSKIFDGKEVLFKCVIDGKGIFRPFAKKETLERSLIKYFKSNKGLGEVDGTVRIELDYNPKSVIDNSKEKGEETESSSNEEFDYLKRSKTYIPVEPSYTFDRVILSDETLKKIENAINIIIYENKVFNEWGLSAIQPNPSSALSFFGPSGTGKTMAAEAIANKLGKKILKASYADIESKYHGEGPKMVKAIFKAAEDNDAVLFIDEADSLLSRRLTNVTQGSEQAINSMRSQLLICLEQFHGIIIFATNLVVNYDKAFLTRLISVEFKKPDEKLRKKIWDVHIYPTNGNNLNIPLAKDIDTNKLAKNYDFSGREIRKAVISACVNVAMNNRTEVTQNDFEEASKQVMSEEDSLKSKEVKLAEYVIKQNKNKKN